MLTPPLPVCGSVHSRVCPGPRAGRAYLANRDEQAAALHDSADAALNLSCTYTLCDAGNPGHTAASQQEHSQLSRKLQALGGGDGGGRSPVPLTMTLIFCPNSQWSHLALPGRRHEKYSVPDCKTLAW
eukprot:scaffold14588_cov59-Phaeocystis_antarctica.AAC.1